jgi:hypothetical protein
MSAVTGVFCVRFDLRGDHTRLAASSSFESCGGLRSLVQYIWSCQAAPPAFVECYSGMTH